MNGDLFFLRQPDLFGTADSGSFVKKEPADEIQSLRKRLNTTF